MTCSLESKIFIPNKRTHLDPTVWKGKTMKKSLFVLPLLLALAACGEKAQEVNERPNLILPGNEAPKGFTPLRPTEIADTHQGTLICAPATQEKIAECWPKGQRDTAALATPVPERATSIIDSIRNGDTIIE